MRVRAVNLLAVAVVSFAACVLVSRSADKTDPFQPQMTDGGMAEATLPEIVSLRPLAKAHLARDVAAGRLSLADAAALFGALDRLPPEPAESLDPHRSASAAALPTAEDRLCRQVINWVEHVLLPDLPRDQCDSVVARFEAEFQHLRDRGPLRLPDPSTLEPVTDLLARLRGILPATFRGNSL